MEILKRGIPPKERTYDITCRNCASELRFVRDEATLVVDTRDGNYYQIACPVCQENITMFANFLMRPFTCCK